MTRPRTRLGLPSAEATRLRLLAITESSEDAVISKTLKGIVTSWNPAAERLYGYATGEMVGQSIARLVPPELGVECAL